MKGAKMLHAVPIYTSGHLPQYKPDLDSVPNNHINTSKGAKMLHAVDGNQARQKKGTQARPTKGLKHDQGGSDKHTGPKKGESQTQKSVWLCMAKHITENAGA